MTKVIYGERGRFIKPSSYLSRRSVSVELARIRGYMGNIKIPPAEGNHILHRELLRVFEDLGWLSVNIGNRTNWNEGSLTHDVEESSEVEVESDQH